MYSSKAEMKMEIKCDLIACKKNFTVHKSLQNNEDGNFFLLWETAVRLATNVIASQSAEIIGKFHPGRVAQKVRSSSGTCKFH